MDSIQQQVVIRKYTPDEQLTSSSEFIEYSQPEAVPSQCIFTSSRKSGIDAFVNALNSEGELQVILDSLSEFIFFKDLDNRNILVNKAVADSLDTTPDKVAGTPTEVWYPEHANWYHLNDLEVIESGLPKRNIVEPIIDANDNHRMFRTDKFPLHDNDRNIIGILVVAQEISKEDSLFELLNRAGRLDALAQLATGEAQNFRSFLWVIQAHVDAAKEGLVSGHPVHENLAGISKAIQGCTDLIKRLSTVGHPKNADQRVIELNSLLSETIELVSSIVPDNIKLQLLLGLAVPGVEANKFELSEVLVNLVLNACDAMPDGGVLTLSSDRIDSSNDNQVWSVITVSDTGSGIKPEYYPQMFEPYTSTKKEGLGIGLASSRDIVRSYGGDLTVETADSGGTHINVLLPSINPESN